MKKAAAILALAAVVGAGLWWGLSPRSSTESDPRSTAPDRPSRAPAVLRGTVTDSEGNPVEGARIVAAADGESHRTETGPEGAFAFADLRPGSYEIDVRAEGYAAPGPRPLREVSVEVSPRSDRSGPATVDLTVHRPIAVEGRVVAADEPVEGVQLSVYYLFAEGFRGGLEPFTLSGEAETGADGRFRLEGLAPGRLRIIAESEDYSPRRSRELFVEPGRTREGLVLDLDPRGILAGDVIGGEGEGLRARLEVRGGRLSSPRRVESGRNGEFRVEGLPAGTYRLSARSPGHRIGTADGIEVRRDETTRRAVELEPGEGLFGRVVGPDREPVSGAYVRLRRDGTTRWLRTKMAGKFQWGDAPEQTWSARAFSPQYAASRGVSARPGAPVELQMRPGGHLRGRVVGPDGDPVPGAKVGVASMLFGGPRPYGPRAAGVERVDESGTFRLGPLRPGRYEVEARKPERAAATSSQRTVRSAETTGDLELVLGFGGTVAGVVRSKTDGEPISGATVEALEISSPFDARTTRTDDQGRFELQHVSTGRRSLRIRHGEHLTRVLSGLRVREGGRVEREVVLRADEEGKQFDFQGIGASLDRTDRGVEIRRIIPGGGAEEQGLKRGDVIRSIGGEPVDDLPLSRVVQRIRGRRGEPVELTLERDGRGRFTVEVVRQRVVVGEGRN